MLVSSVHSFLTSREASVLTPASQRSVLLQFASNISSASFYPLGICRGMWLFFSDTGIEGRLIVGGNTIFILTQELRGILIPVPIRLKDNSCLKLELKPWYKCNYQEHHGEWYISTALKATHKRDRSPRGCRKGPLICFTFDFYLGK